MSAPKTADWLIRMRLKGKKPALTIVKIDSDEQDDWFAWRETWAIPVLSLPPSASVDRLDLRCLVGLNVAAIADGYSPRIMAIWAAIKQAMPAYASLTLRSFATGPDDDFGWHWTAASGEKLLTEACP